MADPNNQNNLNEQDPRPEGERFDDVPVEEAPMEVEAPRRAASAEFVVDREIGSQAAMREAMDPANQSLADALRLSFRVLQIVIIVLVALFFTSGFETIGDGQSGVLTRWGRIVPVDGQEALEPGLKFSAWPYPIGQFMVFDIENRSVTPRDRTTKREFFWPLIHGTMTIDQAAESATVNDMLRPERDGYVVTGDGDIAHLRVNAQYEIIGPVEFISRIENNQADRLVELALQRAVVHRAAESSLQEIIGLSEDFRLRVRNSAQSMLDEAGVGIQLAGVGIPDASAPLAIRRSLGNLQNARVEAQQRVTQARQNAEEILINAAGADFQEAIDLLEEYEAAINIGDEGGAELILTQLTELFETEELSGEVARIIEQARAFRSQIESTLGNEARRFLSLLPAYREHPDLVVRQRWMETYARVLSNGDTEVILAPPGVGNIQLQLTGSHEIKEMRQKMRLDRREQESMQGAFGDRRGPYILRAEDRQLQGPGRQLQLNESGGVRGLGRGGN